MNKKTISVLLVITLALGIFAGCTIVPNGSDGGPPRLENCYTTRSLEKEKKDDDLKVVKKFSLEKDKTIYVYGELYNAYEGIHVKYTWIQINKDGSEKEIGTATKAIPEEETVVLTASLESKALKPGKYKIQLSLPKEKDQSKISYEFEVTK